MKYNQFFAELTAAGCYVLRHGANHDIWYSPKTGNKFALSRHGKQEVPTGMERKAQKVGGVIPLPFALYYLKDCKC